MEFTSSIQPHGYSLILYGPPGIGKTSLAAMAPSAVMIDLEGGINALRKNFKERTGKDIVSTPKTLETYDEFMEGLTSAVKSDFKTIVIDTVSALEKLLDQKAAEEYNRGKDEFKQVKTILEVPYGQGGLLLQAHWSHTLKLFQKAQRDYGKHIILVAHSQTRKVEDPTSENYDKFEPDVEKKSVNTITANADAVLFCRQKTIVREKEVKGKHMAKTTGERIIYCLDQPSQSAKNRFGLPEEVPMSPEIFTTIGME